MQQSDAQSHQRSLFLSSLALSLFNAQGILDPVLELAKLEKRAAEAAGRADVIRKRMALPNYGDKTPAAVRAEDEERLAKADAEVAAAAGHMQDMRAMIADAGAA